MLWMLSNITYLYILIIMFFFNDTATTEIYILSYTTLFRSRAARSGRPVGAPRRRCRWPRSAGRRAAASATAGGRPSASRSEEHTSELQSLAYLVCRLLLEKKKKQTNAAITNLQAPIWQKLV